MKSKSDKFYREKIERIFGDQKNIVDIGGGLRISKGQGNRYDKRSEWIRALAESSEYKIMDPVSTFNPDIIGDIHSMPFEANALDAIFCLSVLEHVENPIVAAKEMHRTLRDGGYCFVYVPFLYYYHAEMGYYGDFWRFTKDSISYIFRDFSKMEIQQTRGAIETWLKISPLGRYRTVLLIGYWLDKLLRKSTSSQTSGYYVFLVK